MALLKHQTKIAFIDRRGLDRALEKLARRKLRRTRGRSSVTVSDRKNKHQRRLPRLIEDEEQHLTMETTTTARSQRVWNFPILRSCLRPVEWTDFTPEPRWQWLRRPRDRHAGSGGTYGTISNLPRIACKPLIPVTNKPMKNGSILQDTDPSTPQSAEPNADSRDGDASNLSDLLAKGKVMHLLERTSVTGEATETAMSRRFNWERANLHKKAKQSLSDEREFMERDRAARWLEHQEQRQQPTLRNAAQSQVAPSIVSRRKGLNIPLPWEGKNEFDERQSKYSNEATVGKHRRRG
jgi:hypothetical protein